VDVGVLFYPFAMALVLIVGVMRSGKTSIATALGQLRGVEVIEEPDNHVSRPFAFRAKRHLRRGYFPSLDPDEEAAGYEALWRGSFGLSPLGHRVFSLRERVQRRIARELLWSAERRGAIRPSLFTEATSVPVSLRAVEGLAIAERPVRCSPHVVVTTNAPLSVEWIVKRIPASVIVAIRDPVSVLASWIDLGWVDSTSGDMLAELDPRMTHETARDLDIAVPDAQSAARRAAWFLGALMLALRRAVNRHPEWHVVSYEQTFEGQPERLRDLADHLGLGSSEELETLRGEPRAAHSPVVLRSTAMREARAVLEAFRVDGWDSRTVDRKSS
jgi:hypothetical protein